MTTSIIVISLFFVIVVFPLFAFMRNYNRQKTENDALKNRLQIELDAAKKSAAIDVDVQHERSVLSDWMRK